MSDHPCPSDGVVRLHSGKEAAIRAGHPWVFAGAIADIEGAPVSGDIVEVRGCDGAFIAWAAFSASSQIRARCVSRREREHPDESLVRARLDHSLERRLRLGFTGIEGVRIVHSEGDGLPGLVLDLYGDTVSAQLHHPWVERYREAIAAWALERLEAACVIDRSQRAARAREGLGQSQGMIAGVYEHHPRIVEHGVAYVVDARNGQKTGFYLDQRANRALVSRWAQGRRMLDLYAHTGGFGLAALSRGAAHVTFVESGAVAVDLLHQNLSINGVDTGRFEVVRADVDAFLATSVHRCDIIVMDPPPLARRRGNVGSALKGMSRLVVAAIGVAAPSCLLAVFSCSHHLGRDELERLLMGAASSTGRAIRLLVELGSDADHPSAAGHPEGRYLTGLIAEID